LKSGAVIASHRLVADGAHYFFIAILQHPWPTTFEHARLAAHALSQWPLALACSDFQVFAMARLLIFATTVHFVRDVSKTSESHRIN